MIALGAAIAGDLRAQRQRVSQPNLLNLWIHGVVDQGVAEDLQPSLEVAAEC